MASFLAGVEGFVLFAVLAPILVRWREHTSPVLMHGVVALSVLVVMTAAGAVWIDPFKFWHAAALYGFLVMAYVFAFGAVYKSVSLNLLIEFVAEGGTIPSSAVAGRMSRLFERRSGILVETGHARQCGNAFSPTPAGVLAARRVGALQRLFAIDKAGLYAFSEQESATQDGKLRK